eukprot:EG_transcript_29560
MALAGPSPGATTPGMPRSRDTGGRAGRPFCFRTAAQRLNFEALFQVDLQRVRREVDVDALQGVIKNLTYAATDPADFAGLSAAHVTHVFRLMQMLLQYVLHTQTLLSQTCDQRAAEGRRLVREVEAGSAAVARLAAENARLREELAALQRSRGMECSRCAATAAIAAGSEPPVPGPAPGLETRPPRCPAPADRPRPPASPAVAWGEEDPAAS